MLMFTLTPQALSAVKTFLALASLTLSLPLSLSLVLLSTSFVPTVHATPIPLPIPPPPVMISRDVITPKIIQPDASAVWSVGSVQVVSWDTSDLPPDSEITNPIGKVVLGYDENGSLNLDFDNPLVQGFNLRDGNVTLTVPDVVPRDDYLIVLYGNSGNTSPTFTITAKDF
ncbi:hypothetical protein CVT24_003497 [Panaeolus cyanescens]|uniref:Uncharacterized protein n=1 Tax=Panaeolus cyanescens TaxID=181874 RepID=A0A409WMX5_9AGAR|nr:hypothetical protein CVT24_003497 [Panaeolus cyanescens]